jgi:radical SAM-linked protein
LDPVIFRGDPKLFDRASKIEGGEPAEASRLRLTFTKVDRAMHLSHLEMVRVFLRAMKRAGIRLVYSKGFHPMPRLSFANALPVGVESLQETADVDIQRGSDDRNVAETINRHLPPGIRVTSVETVVPGKKSPRLVESHFIVTLDGAELKPEDLQRFLASSAFPVKKVTQKGEKVVNARDLVKSASLDSPNEVTLVVRHSTGPEIKPADIVKAIFALAEDRTPHMRILKIRQIVE